MASVRVKQMVELTLSEVEAEQLRDYLEENCWEFQDKDTAYPWLCNVLTALKTGS